MGFGGFGWYGPRTYVCKLCDQTLQFAAGPYITPAATLICPDCRKGKVDCPATHLAGKECNLCASTGLLDSLG
jgi:hypothetical protein